MIRDARVRVGSSDINEVLHEVTFLLRSGRYHVSCISYKTKTKS